MGHQAAQCKTGTIPWRQVFGDEAFVVRKPVFWTDVLSKRDARKVDHDKLTADAVNYARAACEAQGKNYDADVIPVAEASQSVDTAKLLETLRDEVEIKEKEAKIAADPAANLPPGWNVAYVRHPYLPRHRFCLRSLTRKLHRSQWLERCHSMQRVRP